MIIIIVGRNERFPLPSSHSTQYAECLSVQRSPSDNCVRNPCQKRQGPHLARAWAGVAPLYRVFQDMDRGGTHTVQI